ncbi:adhesin [Neisseria gonorrhoeae]|nr:adhesin [Neisseria gonorrhoeae]
MYSGLTKTGTALPRLAVLFVLSAASSPCPDLNLIHYMHRLAGIIDMGGTYGLPGKMMRSGGV